MKQLRLPLLALLGAMLLNGLTGCKKDGANSPAASSYSSEVANEWFDLYRRIVKDTPGFTPPVAARVYGYSSVALYQAVVPGMDGYQSLEGLVNGLSHGDITDIDPELEYHWGICANAALAQFARLTLDMVSPENLARIDSMENAWQTTFATGTDPLVVTRSADYGHQVATDVRDYCNSDGQELCYLNNFPVDYVPPVGTEYWVPTPPAFQRALQPYWGNVRPFVAANIDLANMPAAPPAFSTDPNSLFYVRAMEVYSTVNNLSTEQTTIAHFWSDDPGKTATPPGHSISWATIALRQNNANLAFAAEVYARTGMSVHDAFISCWKAKYIYNLLRPVTYIRQYIDPAWSSILNTPPFPEYTSGHSVQSGASSKVLSELFGYNYAFTDNTHASRIDIDGTPRNFSSFYEAADEAAISRLYGGIHYREAIELGVQQGRDIGARIMAIPLK